MSRDTSKDERKLALDRVEGRNPVAEALKGRRKVRKVIFAAGSEKSRPVKDILSLSVKKKVPIEERSKRDLERMAVTRTHQGIIAIVEPYAYLSLGELLERPPEGRRALLLVLDGIEDPQNFGALLRVADAVGADGLIVGRSHACPVTAAVSRASAGAVEHVKIAQVANIPETIKRLKEKGIWVMGADASGRRRYYDADLRVPLAVVMGAEGRGLGRLVKERCDMLVSVPMMGSTSSLNVSTAAAAILYEVLRQRRPPRGTRK